METLDPKQATEAEERFLDAIMDAVDDKCLRTVAAVASFLKVPGSMVYGGLNELVARDRVNVINGDPRQYLPVANHNGDVPDAPADNFNGHAKALKTNGTAEDPMYDRFEKLQHGDRESKKEEKEYYELKSKIKGRIMAAVDAEYRTLAGIKKHIGAPKRFDVTDVLEDLCGDYLLRKHPAGPVTAFFRYETMPLSVKLVGDGRVEAEFDEAFTPRDEKAKLDELTYGRKHTYGEPNGKKAATEPEADDDDILELDTLEDIQPDKLTPATAAEELVTPAAAVPAKEDEHLAAGVIEDLAKENPDKVWIARQLKTTIAKLEELFTAQPQLKDAWKRGRAMYNEAQKNMNGAATAPAETSAIVEQNIQARRDAVTARLDRVTAEEVKTAAAEHSNLHEIAKAVAGCGQPAFSRMLNRRPEIKDAYEEGRKQFLSEQSDTNENVGRLGKVLYTAELFRNAAAEGLSKRQLADRLGLKSQSPISNQLQHPEYAAAWKEGVEIYKNSSKPATEGTIDQYARELGHAEPPATIPTTELTTEGLETSEYMPPPSVEQLTVTPEPGRKPFEEVVSSIKMEIAEEDAARRPGHATKVQLGTGSIVIGMDINLFEESRENRDKIMELVDLVQGMKRQELQA